MALPLIIVLGVSGLASLGCWISLWRGGDVLWAKVGWSVASVVPVVGPILYAGLHSAPPVMPELDQGKSPRHPEG